MKKIVNFPEAGNIEDFEIEITRSKEFVEIAHDLGDLIKTLPLDQKQNDDLVYLMVKQVTEAEANAYREGVKMAAAFNEYMEENK
ncbi:hypothetical protein [Acetobacterium tundrae]|uniref:Phage protein n=1 Tax=Acetobacterium tundrae TaxID=132932 RepID=A0ABR6WL50_9FIRM|nr:hypothetical protein [Acetobacterium tundrae]MBC3797161.1 hypothetical protein [Acetobacterium tundrae]